MALRNARHTYSEISNLIGIPKTTVFRITKIQLKVSTETKKLKSGASPYGYVLINGSLVEDPKEQQVIQIIMRRWYSGESFKTIAQFLNSKGFVTKMYKSWSYFSVKTVIERRNK